jgi:hypothetical protein
VLPERDGDVLGHGERREERAVLEQHAEAPAQRVHARLVGLPHVLAEEARATARGPQQADHLLQQDRLARPAAADERDQLAAPDAKAHARRGPRRRRSG